MSDKNDGGAAFPIHTPYYTNRGMSLRDYFAARALPAFLAAKVEHQPKGEIYKRLAQECYALADAMLRARDA